jgi:S1-C subfamily serine protease
LIGILQKNQTRAGYIEVRCVRAIIWFLLSVLALVPVDRGLADPVQPDDDTLRMYAVHVGDFYGVYLGSGLIITAAHVVGFAKPKVRIAGVELPAKILKAGSFEREDLTLLSIDSLNLPISLQMRRMPLCEAPPFAGQPVIVAIPESTARSRIMSPHLLPADVRWKFPTVIGDVATTGNSGSGVFDPARKCLLGIMSRKFQVRDAEGKTKDIAKYFVPASTIRTFIPATYRF